LFTANYRSGLFEEAEKTYRKLLVDEPRHADALFLLASITHRTGRDEDALELISRAVSCNLDVPEFYCASAQIYASLKRPKEAIAQYAQALSRAPNLTDAHYNLGLLLQEQCRIDEAAGHYMQVVSIAPAHIGALFRSVNRFIIRIRDRLGRTDKFASAVSHHNPASGSLRNLFGHL
jgi:tetratricopeptide (TPR) repeat protein